MGASGTVVVLLFLALGCSSGPRAQSAAAQANAVRPDVVIRQASKVYFHSEVSAPVTIEVQITNRAAVPLRVISVRVSSVGGAYVVSGYGTLPEEIAPGETRTLNVFATAYVGGSSDSRANYDPMATSTLRANLELQAGNTKFHHIVTQLTSAAS